VYILSAKEKVPMKRYRPAKRRGFTLVELLLVIVIISILSGMVMLSTGSALDSAESVRVLNDLRNLKGAALMYFVDANQWPGSTDGASLDRYMDRPLFSSGSTQYNGLRVASYNDGGVPRGLIGLGLYTADNQAHRPSVRRKLINNALGSGLKNSAGNDYNGENAIYTAMN
jgi:general secretion pathway protein G